MYPFFTLDPIYTLKTLVKTKSFQAVSAVGSLFASGWVYRKSFDKCTCTKDLTGKTVVITGGSSGIGKSTALALARRNATIIIGARNGVVGTEAVKEIRTATGNQKVSYKHLDLCCFESVRKFAEDVKQAGSLNVLINNAGVIGSESGSRTITEDGCEYVMQANYLGHFLLTLLLLDLMKKSGPSRIINVTSRGHKWGYLEPKDLSSSDGYSTYPVYFKSKLANVLFTTELSKKLENSGVTVNVANPGFVKTKYLRRAPPFRGFIMKILYYFYGKTPFQGAQTIVHLAASPKVEEVSGKYFSNVKERKLTKAARKPELCTELFEKSEIIVGLKV